MSTLVTPPAHNNPFGKSPPPVDTAVAATGESIRSHLVTALLYTVASVVALGIIYPLVIAGIGTLLFPHQAGGSLVERDGKVVGSAIIGQLFTKPGYFQGRPSAAGKNGYDPTATGGTNLAPTSKKLIDATKATLAALKKANPDAPGRPPMDLVTSSGSGIDRLFYEVGVLYEC